MKQLITILTLLLVIVSCNRVKQKTKETINEGGELVGKTASEFFEGFSEGVERTLDCEVILSSSLKNKGLKTGKFFIGQDSISRVDNVLRLYLIFDKDFDDNVSAKVFDKNGLESGRVKMKISGVSGDAKYFDFSFDKETHIEVKSKIMLE